MVRQLAPRSEERIEWLIASGQYADADQVIEEALQLLEARTRRIQKLRALLALGEEHEARGELFEFTPELFEEIKQTAREKAQTAVGAND